jgi:hypothetical protein
MLLLSSSCCLGSFFALLPSSLVVLLFQVQGFSRCYSRLRATIIGVLLFVEESYTTPLHSFLQELGMVGSQESKICIFLVSIFPFAHFHFYFFNLMSFVPLFFFYWFLVCGTRFVINYFGDKPKPLYF